MTIPSAAEDAEEQAFSCTASGKQKWYNHFGKQFGIFLKTNISPLLWSIWYNAGWGNGSSRTFLSSSSNKRLLSSKQTCQLNWHNTRQPHRTWFRALPGSSRHLLGQLRPQRPRASPCHRFLVVPTDYASAWQEERLLILKAKWEHPGWFVFIASFSGAEALYS